MTNLERVRSTMPDDFSGQGVKALNENYMQDAEGASPRATTDEERGLIGEMGVGGFNRAVGSIASGDGGMGTPAAAGAAPSAAAPQAVSAAPAAAQPQADRAADSTRAMGELGINRTDMRRMQREGFKALTPNYAMDGGTMRPVSGGERQLINEMGMDRFNRAFSPPAEGAGGTTRASQIGQPLDAPTRAGDTAEAGVLGDAAQRQDQAAGRSGGFMAGMRGAMSEAVAEGRGGFQAGMGQQGGGMRQIVDTHTGRVTEETADGESAREILGPEEFAQSSDRGIRFEQEGSWVSEGGRMIDMSTDQGSYMSSARRVREAMGNDDAFRNFMQNDIRMVPGGNDPATGVPFISENPTATDPGIRSATPSEVIAKSVAGDDDFSTAGQGRREFLGDGALVRDEGTRRMATGGESELYQKLGPVRFNDVMGRRVEDAGTGNSYEPARRGWARGCG